MKRIIFVAGARPNLMKIAPLIHELQNHPYIRPILVHTGQHYDLQMSGQFFKELNIPEPDINLEVGSCSHAIQTARIMEGFEKVCLDVKPDFVMVFGDVNSTAACSLVAAKMNIKTIHYEAGLRSFDRTMPEEINRLVTDAISDLFFTTSKDANENLIREGIEKKKIHMVGNLMIDTLVANLGKTSEAVLHLQLLPDKTRMIRPGIDFQKKSYGLMTFHRPSNVDDKTSLENLFGIWKEISRKIPLIFPVHPRTYKNLLLFGFLKDSDDPPPIFFIEPQGYLTFIQLVKNSLFVLTDSGGIQEETTWLNIPCLTVRPSTERPITISEGSNKLIQPQDIIPEVDLILQGKGKKGTTPDLWDGKTARRIVQILESLN